MAAVTEGCSAWLGLFLLCALQQGEMHSALLRSFWHSEAGSPLLCWLVYCLSKFMQAAADLGALESSCFCAESD